MNQQIPDGPENLNCHRCFPKKIPMSKVCKSCGLWMQVRGKDKNTGRDIDEWMCADRAQILFLGEIAKNTLSSVSAVESFRNETVAANMVALNGVFGYRAPAPIPSNQIASGSQHYIEGRPLQILSDAE